MLQRPLDLGATFVVHSTTKYLNGHSDVVGGAIVTSDEVASFTNTKFVDVAFTGKFAIPATQKGFLVATFTGESNCEAAEWCSVRITCDGVELQPHGSDPFDFAFIEIEHLKP